VTQTLAIFLDAYRELNARKMFWVSLILTAVFVILFALFAPDGNRMRFVTMSWSQPNASLWYKTVLLQSVLISVWISWVAIILALISTASIFPDFVSGGAIDLYLSKPIGRLRLFLTKYAAALLFVIGQADVFSVLAFHVVGVRAGEWKWGLFLTIPLLALFFSYLFSFCVLLGMWTRSVIASLMLTMLLWIGIWGVHTVETLTLLGYNTTAALSELQQKRADRAQWQIDHPAETQPASTIGTQPSDRTNATAYRSNESPKERRGRAQREADEAAQSANAIGKWHNGFYIAKTMLPKTSETIGLMSRALFEEKEIDAATEERFNHMTSGYEDEEMLVHPMSMVQGQLRTEKEIRSRSVGWVIGTSLIFEAVMLFFAARMFCRRDF
jgi:ABC-type transport system involved in multi-copper enzyme maturation permease subunit